MEGLTAEQFEAILEILHQNKIAFIINYRDQFMKNPIDRSVETNEPF